MSSFYWLWAYFSAFWGTVVINCAQPTNWERCSKVDDWLVPWARDAVEMYHKGAYHAETVILEQVR